MRDAKKLRKEIEGIEIKTIALWSELMLNFTRQQLAYTQFYDKADRAKKINDNNYQLGVKSAIAATLNFRHSRDCL